MKSKLNDFLNDESKVYNNLNINDHDLIKLSSKSRYTNDIVRRAMKNEIVPFPKFDSFKLMDKNDWGYINKKIGDTYQLYIHSLRFVNELLLQYEYTKERKYVEKAKEYIESWINYALHNKGSRMLWYDHPTAQRLQVLLYFVYLNQDKINFDLNKYGRLLEFHGNFLAEEAKYHRTNHGLMMDRSLMSLGTVLKNENLFNIGYYRSIDTFWFSYSHQGMHLENSPGYHSMVTKMYRQIEEMLNKNGKSYGETITNTLDMAEELEGTIVLPNGYYPPIGDTGNAVEKENKNYINFVDYQAGLSIVQKKEKQIYLTFISGYSSITHKHFDDLSITLYFMGEKFLEDAGRYNYSRNPYRFYVKSVYGHSGLFIDDGNYRISNDNRYRRKITTDHHLETEAIFQVKGKNSSDNRADLFRHVIFLKKENVFIIIDQIKSYSNIDIIHNFNLYHKVDINQFGNDNFILSNNNLKLALNCYSPIDQINIVKGKRDAKKPIAINSTNFGTVEKTQQLHFRTKCHEDERKNIIFTLAESDKNIEIAEELENELLIIKVNNKKYYINY